MEDELFQSMHHILTCSERSMGIEVGVTDFFLGLLLKLAVRGYWQCHCCDICEERGGPSAISAATTAWITPRWGCIVRDRSSKSTATSPSIDRHIIGRIIYASSPSNHKLMARSATTAATHTSYIDDDPVIGSRSSTSLSSSSSSSLKTIAFAT